MHQANDVNVTLDSTMLKRPSEECCVLTNDVRCSRNRVITHKSAKSQVGIAVSDVGGFSGFCKQKAAILENLCI